MKNLTYQTYLADPSATHAQIQRAAARARVEAVNEHMIAPLVRFCGRLSAIRGITLQLDPRAVTW